LAGSLKLGGLFTEPIADRTIADCARAASISKRNLARLFAREIGKSFGVWR
jgi:transcriptional regulator GlxA family with amidase domain